MKARGLKPSAQKVRDFDYDVCCKSVSSEELPSKFMLPIDEWAEVLDQLDINACASFALVTAQEVNYFKKTGGRKLWSPGYIYGNPLCRNGYTGEGMYLDTAIKGTTKTGFVPLLQFDLLEEMPGMMKRVEERDDLAAIGAEWKLSGYVNCYSSTLSKKIEKMKQALYNYQVPLVVSSHGYFGGGHAFIIYGWDDDMQFKKYAKTNTIFALRNSWGKGYQNGGNYFIPASEVDAAYLPLFEEISLPFTDVKEEDWFFNDVRKGYLSGLIKGVSATTFEPDAKLIRGDAAVTGARLLTELVNSVNAFIATLEQKGEDVQHVELQDASEARSFVDIAPDDYYKDEIALMCANAVMEGTSENEFEPKRPILRCEFAAMVVRVRMHINSLINVAIPSANLTMDAVQATAYNDVKASDWYYNYAEKAQEFGLMQGDGDGNFRPLDNITRAEATAVWNRLFRDTDKSLEGIQ